MTNHFSAHKKVILEFINTKTRTTRMPAFWGYPPPPNDYPFYWFTLDPKSNLPKFQILEFWHKHYTRHTFWSCLIGCANMKWIRQILLKIQSGHDSVHRRTDRQTDRWTDGQGETSIPPFNFAEAGGIITLKWAQKQFVMRVHTLFYFLHNKTNP